MALEEETPEMAKNAVCFFEKQLELSEVIGDYESSADAEYAVALAKSKSEGRVMNTKELLKASQGLYELGAVSQDVTERHAAKLREVNDRKPAAATMKGCQIFVTGQQSTQAAKASGRNGAEEGYPG